ncbi:hypothetical protein GCM10007897_34760 [Sphingobium jiangsuense]|uniref:Uncharacterized protein n=1 Tax=Sphingobium jiangsuense TaxID=870476 RepID=A0A7W6FRF3_9SPHN|nr:hypothetical protein [Sphingobium jiangsuense]MBB3926984.1 hypothetical protein [Sphingobium jiangsuense]GLT02073.1 hypothetical protein GCM10007897_34760 [Sphingobium jiangsuense]
MDRLYDAIARRMPGTIWATGCKSSYMDRNGQIALWPWSYEQFQEQLREPDMEDFHPFLVPHY